MFSYEIYKVLHFLGIFMIFVSLGGVMLYTLNGGVKADNNLRKTVGITHGIGLICLLIGGFGMMARLSIQWPWPGWLYTKLIIWFVLGGISGLIYKLGTSGKAIWYLVILFGAIAAYMAIFKPF